MKINSTLVRQQVFLLFSHGSVIKRTLALAQCAWSARHVRTNATYFTNIINKLVFYYSTLPGEIVDGEMMMMAKPEQKKNTQQACKRWWECEREMTLWARARENGMWWQAVAVWVPVRRDQFKSVKQTKTIYKQIGWHNSDDMVNKANFIHTHLTR